MLKFRSRVLVFAPDMDRIVFWASPLEAQRLVSTTRAIVKEKKGKIVEQIRLTACNLPNHLLGCRAGSFGIRREITEHGTTIFQHKGAWDSLRGEMAA